MWPFSPMGGGELIDFYEGGVHVRPFSKTPKYVDEIFKDPKYVDQVFRNPRLTPNSRPQITIS